MSGEKDLLAGLLARLDSLEASAQQDLSLLGKFPEDADAFLTIEPIRQTASRGVLKCFEQIEDQLARVFRLLPIMLGIDTDGWYMQDYADFMEKAGVLSATDAWMDAVRLRNRLVHDYPIDSVTQHERLGRVIDALAQFSNIHRRLAVFVASRSELS